MQRPGFLDPGKACSIKKIWKEISELPNTRWRTHGEPNDRNAHPHLSMKQAFCTGFIIGIIENYAELKSDLIKNGYQFHSETDTEVLVNLIEFFYRKSKEANAEVAVRMALSKVVGAYGIAVICEDEKDQIIAGKERESAGNWNW